MPVLVIPDVGLPRALAEEIAAQVGPPLFHHPSGAPWIVGDPGGRRVLSAGNGRLDVVLIGDGAPDVDAEALAGRVRGRGSVADLDGLAAELVEGDVLLLAREHGRLRAQGPLFLTRALFWSRAAGVHLVADDQLTLARLTGAGPDPAVLTSRLTEAELSHPFALRPIWEGVRGPGPGEWLDCRSAEAPVRRVWWRPPRPDRSLAELSDPLRQGLRAALSRRVATHRVISADLSGGLDSTTLAFTLAEIGRSPHTLFLRSGNAANNDHLWADRAATELGTDHRVAPYDSVIPLLLAQETGSVTRFPEGPGMGSVSVAATSLVEELVKDTGTTLHLTGHAGDALFGPVSTMLWSLTRSRVKGRIRRSRRHRVINRYPLGKTLRMLVRNESYREELTGFTRSDFRQGDEGVSGFSRWIPLPRTHPALTELAREQLRELAREAIDDRSEALSPDRTLHQIVQYLTVHGNAVRRMNLASTPGLGIHFDSPYLDRRTVEPALSLRIGDRTHQDPAKPLLAAARPARMSLDYFTRRDKGDYTADVFEHHRALRPVLREMFAGGSALEDLGLIAPEQVSRSIDQFSANGRGYTDLVHLAFGERWLRSARQETRSLDGSRQGGGNR
ncbi:asparagine synthase-related protein [Streptomyces hainanensis]|uniref:asparagine synthase (glutamine-hydrolyzing) n=1 Tax=Streptomyces hainanensis TaxID=402648 RepID=A0A4R4TWW0_9ACTN|nr:asparagine synthase-related protein [Streptomyces hainanensis]TDC78639.1 hypothetical protein E1283_04600 [Streptomyces hainanensis]